MTGLGEREEGLLRSDSKQKALYTCMKMSNNQYKTKMQRIYHHNKTDLQHTTPHTVNKSVKFQRKGMITKQEDYSPLGDGNRKCR